MKNRSKYDILTYILDSANGRGELSLAKLAETKSITYVQIRESLGLAIETELVERNKQGRTFRVTKKGWHFVWLNDCISKLIQIPDEKAATN
jgi:predicted transcriptional regulator